jgi:hypothetical protein
MQASHADVNENLVPGARGVDCSRQQGHADNARACDDRSADMRLSIDDCDCLLGAVTTRLRRAVAEAAKPLGPGAGSSLQGSVLECADAIDRLRRLLRSAL